MRVGFIVTLCEQLERFEPILRRTPGARFLVPAGRWPSPHHDSRQRILQCLYRRGLPPVTEAGGDFDLVVTAGESPASSIEAWLRPGGTLVQWRDPCHPSFSPTASSLVLASGPALLPPDGDLPSAVVGDPLLDTALEAGAAVRARRALGLSVPAERPLVLVHAEAGSRAVHALADALASLRLDFDVVVTASTEARLARSDPLPRALSGPGVSRPGEDIPRAELLAAADLVLAEGGGLLVEAAALGKPAWGLGAWNLPARRSGGVVDPVQEALRRWQWVDDAGELRALVSRCDEARREWAEWIRPVAQSLVGVADGGSTRRFVSSLRVLGPPDFPLPSSRVRSR